MFVDSKLSSTRPVDGQNGRVESFLKHMSRKHDTVEEEDEDEDHTLERLRILERLSSALVGEIERMAITKTKEPLNHTLTGSFKGNILGADGVQILSEDSKELSSSDDLTSQNVAFLAVDVVINGCMNASSNVGSEAFADRCRVQYSSFNESSERRRKGEPFKELII